MRSFPAQKIVVTAVRLVGIFVADAGPRLVDGAAPRFGVEEHAGRAERRVLLMAEDVLAGDDFRESAERDLGIDAEVLCQSIDVALRHFDPIVSAAIRGTLAAVVQGLSGHAFSWYTTGARAQWAVRRRYSFCACALHPAL